MELSSTTLHLVWVAQTTGEHSEEAKEIAWKAQHRLHKRYMRLGAAGKPQGKIITAVARELLGFIWAIGTKAEMTVSQRTAA